MTAYVTSYVQIIHPDTEGAERERVEHLFVLYEKMCAPLEANIKGKRKR